MFEGLGFSAGFNQSIEYVKPFGTIALLGNPNKNTEIQLANHSQILRKEINIHGVWNSYYASTPRNEWKYTVEMMDQENFRVSRATLYSTNILLINARLVIKHQFGTSSQYEKSYNRETHHHQICTQCGKVTEFQNEELQHAIENTKLSRFQLSHYSLYIYVICSKCDRSNKRKKVNNNNKKER